MFSRYMLVLDYSADGSLADTMNKTDSGFHQNWLATKFSRDIC
jgi:hypothetical protein